MQETSGMRPERVYCSRFNQISCNRTFQSNTGIQATCGLVCLYEQEQLFIALNESNPPIYRVTKLLESLNGKIVLYLGHRKKFIISHWLQCCLPNMANRR